MTLNLTEQVAIRRTKAALEEVRKAWNAIRLLEEIYKDADYGSEPMSALGESEDKLVESKKMLEHALAVIEGRT